MAIAGSNRVHVKVLEYLFVSHGCLHRCKEQRTILEMTKYLRGHILRNGILPSISIKAIASLLYTPRTSCLTTTEVCMVFRTTPLSMGCFLYISCVSSSYMRLSSPLCGLLQGTWELLVALLLSYRHMSTIQTIFCGLSYKQGKFKQQGT